MELKAIPVDKILANFYQPRTKFDKEKIHELAESILSNGLINPITVTPDKKRQGKYMIVSGERRWQAHRVAKLKTIQCFVKEFKSQGQFMVESLIENLHREDLTPTEKGKFCLKIKNEMKLEKNEQISKVVNKPTQHIDNWIDDYQFNKEKNYSRVKQPTHTIIRATKGFPEEERKKLIAFAEGKNITKTRMRTDDFEEDFVPVYKKADEPTKKALLSGKVTVEEAKQENVPEPIELERTANDVVDDILSNLHNFKYNVDELLKSNVKSKINIEDLSKSKADKSITTAGLHLKTFKEFVNVLRQRGAKPDKMILALIKANGKI